MVKRSQHFFLLLRQLGSQITFFGSKIHGARSSVLHSIVYTYSYPRCSSAILEVKLIKYWSLGPTLLLYSLWDPGHLTLRDWLLIWDKAQLRSHGKLPNWGIGDQDPFGFCFIYNIFYFIIIWKCWCVGIN